MYIAEVPLHNGLVLASLCEYCDKLYIAKTLASFDYVFVAYCINLSSTTVMKSASKATHFGRKRQHNGHFDVQVLVNVNNVTHM